MKLKTKLLQDMMGSINKCKTNKILEITNYCEIALGEYGLIVTCTDGTNFITGSNDEVGQEEEEKIVVRRDQFSKLIAKTTTEYVTLELTEDCLLVKGNGTHKVEVYLNEAYPDFDANTVESYKISTNKLCNAIDSCSKSKSNTAADGVLFNYLIRNGAMVCADAIKVAYCPVEELDMEVLIQPMLADLLSCLDGEVTNVYLTDDEHILFEGKTVNVYGPLAEGASEFPDVISLLTEKQRYECELDIQLMLQSIDRLKLFITKYDGGVINLTFTEGAVIMSTFSGCVESVPYVSVLDEEVDVTLAISGIYLTDLLTSVQGSTVKLSFGEDELIQLKDGEREFLLAVAEEA